MVDSFKDGNSAGELPRHVYEIETGRIDGTVDGVARDVNLRVTLIVDLPSLGEISLLNLFSVCFDAGDGKNSILVGEYILSAKDRNFSGYALARIRERLAIVKRHHSKTKASITPTDNMRKLASIVLDKTNCKFWDIVGMASHLRRSGDTLGALKCFKYLLSLQKSSIFAEQTQRNIDDLSSIVEHKGITTSPLFDRLFPDGLGQRPPRMDGDSHRPIDVPKVPIPRPAEVRASAPVKQAPVVPAIEVETPAPVVVPKPVKVIDPVETPKPIEDTNRLKIDGLVGWFEKFDTDSGSWRKKGFINIPRERHAQIVEQFGNVMRGIDRGVIFAGFGEEQLFFMMSNGFKDGLHEGQIRIKLVQDILEKLS